MRFSSLQPHLFVAFLFSFTYVVYGQSGPGGPGGLADFEFTIDCPEVNFISTSLGSAWQGTGPPGPDAQIISESWDFGDGTTGTGSQTAHLYTSNGTYYVCLTVIDEYQDSDQFCDTIEINCIPECQAGFQVDSNQCPDFSFYNTSIIDPGDQIVSFNWDFDDGITNTNSDPSHTYQQNDVYEVCLFIETENGCSDYWCDTIVVDCIVFNCNSQFELDSSGCPNINFYDLSTIDSSDQIWSYNWSFGDGSNSASINPIHTYSSNGIYLVCLNIETMFDCESEFCAEIDISCISTASIGELTTSKTLIQILDLMGRETPFKPNTPLIYVYDDGSTEKVFSVEY